MPSQEQVLQLVAALYDAAADTALWSPFLQQLALACGAGAADLLMHDVKQHSHTIANFYGFDPENIRLYNQHYYQIDPWTATGSAKPAGWVGVSEELCDSKTLLNGEYYNEFLMPKGNVGHAMFGVIENGNGKVSNVSILRPPSSKTFAPDDLKLLQTLIPHLQRAFQIHFQISELRSFNLSLQAALDMVSTAIVLLGAKGQIVAMNSAASKLLSASDGLLATRMGLRAEHPTESANLGKLIAEAIATANSSGLKPAGTQTVSRRTGGPLQVLVTPIRNLPLDLAPGACALVIISDPSARVPPA